MRGWNHRGLKSQAADGVGVVIVTLATASLVPRVSFLSAVRARWEQCVSELLPVGVIGIQVQFSEEGNKEMTTLRGPAGRRRGGMGAFCGAGASRPANLPCSGWATRMSIAKGRL